MKWEYHVIAKPDLGDFIDLLNRLGEEGWEAISGTYTIGESLLVESSARAIPDSKAPRQPQW